MEEVLFGYAVRLLESLAFFISFVLFATLFYLSRRRNWRGRLKQLKDDLDKKQHRIEELNRILDVAHQHKQNLPSALQKLERIQSRLNPDQDELRYALDSVIVLVGEMLRHAQNIVLLSKWEQKLGSAYKLVNLRGIIQGAAKDLFYYADAKGVDIQLA
jgi:hypothetical protein